MLTVYPIAVIAEEILYLQKQFTLLKTDSKFDEIYWITNPDEIQDLYNSKEQRLIQQERIVVRQQSVLEAIRTIIDRVLPNFLNPNARILFSRSFHPIGIHTDTSETHWQGHTLMIPLTFNNDIKTLVWKQTALGQSGLNEIFQRFINHTDSFTKQSNISQQLDLRNCWLGQPPIVDFLELDGIAEWQSGSLFKFERKQLHASNNYKTIVDFKDYVLIHNDK
jgi:hypothetical protein